ncbi:hypothetical protein BGZ80_006517 [Entomortierella chlamydospora]|uniref:Alpha-mannosyltransferase n=1 Tax=Entomortierella chlamydospora TaxID=101097 RepID=A0A9P6N054_9FUNG|nr:hypothetical protein BGZ80_006517 [Entomortierella chlamydospora]
MQVFSFMSSSRRIQCLRIIIALGIFSTLVSVSRYQGSLEFSIDEDGQVQSVPEPVPEPEVYRTHHIATYNPEDIKPWTKEDAAALLTPEGQKIVQALTESPFKPPELLHQNNPHLLKDDYFSTLTKRLRVYRALWYELKGYYDELVATGKQEQLYEAPPSDIAPSLEFLQRIEQVTFPWIWKHHGTSYDLHRKLQNGGRGIVICVGDHHFRYARTSVKALREVLKSTLPIEIYYTGESDLSPENRAWFESFDDVRTIDITKVVDNDMVALKGWAIKPFALLLSRFSEAILLDSEAYFLSPPEVLFEDPGYKEVGTVFFYDRSLFPGAGGNKRAWMQRFLPTMSNHPPKTQWFNLRGDHEMESGVVAIDKMRHFLGLLAICKLNDLYEREQVTYVMTWGDKEAFWIALEMIQERYSFNRFRAGVIGNVGDAIPYNDDLPQEEVDRYLAGEILTETNPINREGKQTHRDSVNMDRVCGNQVHYDYKGRPLWWNTGVVRNKYIYKSPYLRYTAYMNDEDGFWDFDNSCLVQKHSNANKELEWDQRQTAFKILKADRDVVVEINNPSYMILELPRLVKSDGAKGGRGNSEAV